MVFQEHSLFPWLSVRDNVGFGLVDEGRAEGASARRASSGCSTRVRLTQVRATITRTSSPAA